jgi:hypothetical protein
MYTVTSISKHMLLPKHYMTVNSLIATQQHSSTVVQQLQAVYTLQCTVIYSTTHYNLFEYGLFIKLQQVAVGVTLHGTSQLHSFNNHHLHQYQVQVLAVYNYKNYSYMSTSASITLHQLRRADCSHE